jgi:hypothetical protein
MAARPRSTISLRAIPSAIQKLNRRLTELNKVESPKVGDDINGMAMLIANEINSTLDDVFQFSSSTILRTSPIVMSRRAS